MSDLKFCQGPLCHTYYTKDRLKGPQGHKTYQTRRRSSFYYGKGNFCSTRCQDDWFNDFGDKAIDHFGRLTEPKKTMCKGAWYKTYIYNYDNSTSTNYHHYIVNDLLGKKILITEQQYNDDNYTLNTD